MSKFTLTYAIAVAESERRATNRGLSKDDRTKVTTMLHEQGVPDALMREAASAVLGLGTADLADAVECLAPRRRTRTPKPKAKPAAKMTQAEARTKFAEQAKARKGTGAGGSTHTERRAEAWKFRASERAGGRKISLAEAYALFGTASAAEMKQMTEAQIKALG